MRNESAPTVVRAHCWRWIQRPSASASNGRTTESAPGAWERLVSAEEVKAARRSEPDGGGLGTMAKETREGRGPAPSTLAWQLSSTRHVGLQSSPLRGSVRPIQLDADGRGGA